MRNHGELSSLLVPNDPTNLAELVGTRISSHPGGYRRRLIFEYGVFNMNSSELKAFQKFLPISHGTDEPFSVFQVPDS